MATAAGDAQAPLALNIVGNNVDLSRGTFFKVDHSGWAPQIINRPIDVFVFDIEMVIRGGTVTWPASVNTPDGMAPELKVNRRYRFTFYYDQALNSGKWDMLVSPAYTL